MSKMVIFCASYGAIETTLYLATHHSHDRAITIVISGIPDLFKSFQAINERVFHNSIDLLYLEPCRQRVRETNVVTKTFNILQQIVEERRYLKGVFNRHFAKLEGCEVFFQSRGFDGGLFYLMKRLSTRNKLVYIHHSLSDASKITMSKYTPTSIVDLARLIYTKLIYGRDVVLGQFPTMERRFPYIRDEFMDKEVDTIVYPEERKEMLEGFDLSQFRVFEVGNYSVMYFDDSPIVAGDIADVDTYSKELADIFDVVSKYFPEKEIARKYHPHFPDDKTIIKTGDVLPDFIPAELLYSENVELYFTVASGSVCSVEKGSVVSVIDLISYRDNELKNQRKEILVEMSRSEILFPKSLAEFERILIDIKGDTQEAKAELDNAQRKE